jgi:hypothetical protein
MALEVHRKQGQRIIVRDKDGNILGRFTCRFNGKNMTVLSEFDPNILVHREELLSEELLKEVDRKAKQWESAISKTAPQQ